MDLTEDTEKIRYGPGSLLFEGPILHVFLSLTKMSQTSSANLSEFPPQDDCKRGANTRADLLFQLDGRTSANVKAERLNHARELLQRIDHLPDAVAQMVHDCGVSPRQAYHYLQQARRLKQRVPFGDTKVAFTVKLSQELVRRVRSFPNTTGLSTPGGYC